MSDELSMDAYQILQIVVAEPSVHRYNILNQLKELSSFGGKEFDLPAMQELLQSLTDQGFVEYNEKVDSYKITDRGKDLLA